MSNQFATCTIIAKESLAILENMLGFTANVNKDYESEFVSNKDRGYAPGQTIQIKRPPRYTYRAGRIAQPQATVQKTVPLTLSQGGTDLSLNSLERTLSVSSDTMQKMLQGAMATVANEVDFQGLALARNATYNAVGTPGTPPTTAALALQLITDANTKLDGMAAPRDGERSLALSPQMNGQLVTGLAGLFNSQDKLSKQYGKGMMVDSLGLSYFMDQNVSAHVNGTQPQATGTVNGAGQTGAVLTVNAGTITGTITRGTVFTIANVFAVNPQNRESTEQLAQFVATADVAAGATTIPISPAITPTGQFQNVTASPANAALLTLVGTPNQRYASNIAYHRDAFTCAMVPMWMPRGGRGVVDVAQETHKGITIKVTEVYDGKSDETIMRFDTLFGWAATYPEMATRVLG